MAKDAVGAHLPLSAMETSQRRQRRGVRPLWEGRM